MANNTSDSRKGFDNASYLPLVEFSAIPSIKEKLTERNLDPDKFIFQQDSAPVHLKKNPASNAPFINELLNRLKIEFISWPALSPDLSPIEQVWHLCQVELDRLLLSCKPKNKTQLFTLVKGAWANIDNQKVLNIYHSFQRRCAVVKRLRGKNNSKY